MVIASNVVSQLQDSTVTDWISDCSMSKTVRGRLAKVSKSKNGLQLDLANGRKVNWRMPENIAEEVLWELKAAEMHTLSEIEEFSDVELWIQKNNW